jgi:predicted RNA-binding Zn ribbon-like protein
MPIESLFHQLGEPHSEPWCLSFANTGTSRLDPSRKDFGGLEDLRTWLQKKSILAEDAPSTGEDSRILERAIRLREAIYGIGSALAEKRTPTEDDLGELNWSVQKAVVAARIEATGGGLEWNLDSLRASTAGSIGLIALSAAGLFTSGQAGRVRECNNETCGWLFLDLSKNRSRKWCDMSDCGNVAKARRYYAKQKALKSSN